MVHLLTATTTAAGEGSVGALPAGWGALSGAHLTNPFGAFVIVSGKPVSACPESVANAVHATVFRADAGQPAKGEMKGFFTELDQLPKDWWKVVENERGGYQYKTVTKVLGTLVETMLYGCAGSNHVTEELVVSMLNKAAELGVTPDDPRFPVAQLERWVYPEFVHGIASGAPVPLKGAAVLRVRMMEGAEVGQRKDGPELFVRCKIAAKGSSDWRGLILGGRALDCEGWASGQGLTPTSLTR